jgi:tetratricopeptide (TPR) repeat protein
LYIGTETGQQQPIEVVNASAIKEFRISDRPNEMFEVIVAKRGQRDIVAKKYYNIIKTSADRELDKKRKEFQGLLNATNRDYKEIENLSQQLQRLQEQSDSMTIYREAYRIASINKDNASKRVLKYIQLLDEGKSIQEARTALSIKGAAKDLRRSTKAFMDAKKELDTCSTAAVQVRDIPQAIECHEIIISKLEEMDIDPVHIADYYIETAALYIENGQVDKAQQYVKTALEKGYTKVSVLEEIRFDAIIDEDITTKIKKIKAVKETVIKP